MVFLLKYWLTPEHNKIEKIVFETVIDGVTCVGVTGQNNISCSKKGLWFNITPGNKLKSILKLEPAALKELFKKNKNLIYDNLDENIKEIFEERNSFLFR